jgi:hypothetical protein
MLELFHALSSLQTPVLIGDVINDVYNGAILGAQCLDMHKLIEYIRQLQEGTIPEGACNLFDTHVPLGLVCHLIYSMFVNRNDVDDYLTVFYVSFLHLLQRYIGFTLDDVGNPFSPTENEPASSFKEA